MKKMLALATAAMLTLAMCSSTYAQDNAIKVIVNGEAVDFTGDQAPVIQSGRTLVPFRLVFEKMGATVEWFDSIRLCEATYGDVTIDIGIGDTTVNIGDGASIESDVPAQIINGRTMVPLRVLSECLGADVSWDDKTRTVSITVQAVTATPESADYTTASDSVTGKLTINYDYPVVTNDYMMKEVLNKSIYDDISQTLKTVADEYIGDKETAKVTFRITTNEGRILRLDYDIDSELLYSAGYALNSGRKLDQEWLELQDNIPDDNETESSEVNTVAGLDYTLTSYEANQLTDDGTVYITAAVYYPQFSGSYDYIASLNTQLENSAVKNVESFVASYKDDALAAYNSANEHLFEPPYSLNEYPELSEDNGDVVITSTVHETKNIDDMSTSVSVIRFNAATGEVSE